MSILESGNPNHRRVFRLDDKRCFDLWVSMGNAGSVAKITKVFESEGIVSTITGKAPTRQAVWLAIWRFICTDPDAAKPQFEAVYRSHGETLTDDEWKKILTTYSRHLISRKRRGELLRRVGVTKEEYQRYMQNLKTTNKRDPAGYED